MNIRLRSILRLILPALLFAAAALPAYGQLRLARLFSDHVVLQRQKPLKIWGWSKPNDPLTVSLNGQTANTTADAKGFWTVSLAAMEAGGPFELKAANASDNVVVKDVLIGEVWLCSGQSNMEWSVKQSDNFANEKKNADFPKIRHFYVDHVVEIEPQAELKSGEWKVASPETVGDFTAIGFFFAREVYQKLGIPVGLVHSSWGGSQIESWISKEGMLSSDELREYGQNFPKDWAGADALLEKKIKKITLGDENASPTAEDERRYTQPGYDFSKWHQGGPYGQWDWNGVWAYRGNGFMARKVVVPADWTDTETTLGLAQLYSKSDVYVNGKLVFSGILKGKREVILPRKTWKTGENTLVVKMDRAIEPEWFGIGFIGSRGDLFLSNGRDKMALDDQQWKMMPAFSEPHSYNHSSNNVGVAVYNAMIAPIVGLPMRGVLWYQGETNAGRSYQYRKTFPLLIEDWRKKWNDEFFFFFVQLASYGSNQSSNQGSGWAELREAQTMTLSLPKTGMAVTTDIGNQFDIHPTNKLDVGKRLAANALKMTYGLDVVFSGPKFEAVKFENGRAVVKFKFADGGLTSKDKFGYLRGFEIAGADKKFYFAKAEIAGNTVIVSHPEVRNPVTVRYAWSDAPVDANLFNGAGFPAIPFRTDDWPGVTVNNKFN